MNIFDFIKYILSDFWHFVGFIFILSIIGDWLSGVIDKFTNKNK